MAFKLASVANKVGFWSQFVGAILPLFFKGEADKRKVIAIATGVSTVASGVEQAGGDNGL